MGVALMLDQSQLADPRVGLAQAHSELLRQSHQPLARPVEQARSDGFIASVRVATARLSCNSALSLSSPIRWRQRGSEC